MRCYSKLQMNGLIRAQHSKLSSGPSTSSIHLYFDILTDIFAPKDTENNSGICIPWAQLECTDMLGLTL